MAYCLTGSNLQMSFGMMPAELQQITIYSAGVTANAREPEAAKALIRH
jgi:hypothetical protein